MNELFTAERGTGAFFNDRRIRVAARAELKDAIISTGIPHIGRPGQDEFIKELDSLMRQVAGIRRCGSAALDLCWVAAGRFDGFWEHGLSPWDVAAGIVILREAGGIVSDGDGSPQALTGKSIVAANSKLHPLLRAALSGSRRP
jgi:myo-inositol-1(or 4)-monophosphatase